MTVRLRRPTPEGALLGAATAAACLPIVVALVRALQRGWYPVGDNAYFGIRARDVLTSNHPLLGTWTSASLSVGHDVNNPGPLLFDLLALPARIDAIRGIAVGAAALNVGCILAMAVVARRRGGLTRVVGVMAAAAALGWTMGSELVIDPWQPHSLLFPFLLFLVVVWNLLDGDVAVLPVGVLVASLLVQTHLSYAVIVPALGLAGAAGSVAALRRRRAERPDDWAADRRALRTTVLLSVVVGVLAWIQPIIEQLTADEGNLSGLASAAGGGGNERVGLRLGIRFAASVGVVPPAWARPSFGSSLRPALIQDPAAGASKVLAHTVGLRGALLALGLLGLVLALAAVVAWRRRVPAGLSGIVTVGLALGLAILTAAALPIEPRLGIGPHQVRWLWPIAVLIPVTVVHALAGDRRRTAPGLALVAVAFGILALPASRQEAGPLEWDYAMPVMDSISAQLEDLDVQGPLLFRQADEDAMTIFEPYTTPVMLELERQGIGVVTDNEAQARQLGERRLDDGTARTRVVLLEGEKAMDAPPGGRRVAYYSGLRDEERQELTDLRRDLEAPMASQGLRLTERGTQAVAWGLIAGVTAAGPGQIDAAVTLDAGGATVLVAEGLVDPAEPLLADLTRYVELRERLEEETLGVYLVPVDRRPAAS